MFVGFGYGDVCIGDLGVVEGGFVDFNLVGESGVID